MRKWMLGVLALAGSALIAAPSAMAQSEWEAYAETWPEFGGLQYYGPPIGTQLYGYRPLARVAPPGAAPAPRRVYRYRAAPPAVSYFSPPGAGVEAEVEVGPAPGECGTYFYWSDAAGRCVDARLR